RYYLHTSFILRQRISSLFPYTTLFRSDYLCEVVSTAKPQIDGGTVKPIAIMTKERSSALPNVPTGLEQGTPNLEAYTWNAIFLPDRKSTRLNSSHQIISYAVFCLKKNN